MKNLHLKIKSFIFASILFLLHVEEAKGIAVNAMPLTMPQHPMRHFYFMSKKLEVKAGDSIQLFTVDKVYSVNTKTMVDVTCVCGEKRSKLATVLLNGRTKSCGCIRKNAPIGLKFGYIEVLSNPIKGRVTGICDCGSTKTYSMNSLKNGHTKSCGCINILENQEGKTYNGFLITKDYVSTRPRKVLAICPGCNQEKEYLLGGIRNSSKRSCTSCATHRKLPIKSDSFAVINEESLYWAGFLAADGNVFKGTVCVGLHSKDDNHILKFRNFLASSHKVTRTPKKSSIKFSDKQIVEDLNKFGITDNKSLTYEVPEFCALSSDFWRGIIDGDGSICLKENKHAILSIVGTFSVVDGFLKFAKQFCDTKISPRHSSKTNKNTYSASLSCRNARLILGELYGGNPIFYLDRKYEKAMSLI